jgi:hypothetical protein
MSNEHTDSAAQGSRLAPLQAADFTDEMRQFLLRMLQLNATPDADDRKQAAGYRQKASTWQYRTRGALMLHTATSTPAGR